MQRICQERWSECIVWSQCTWNQYLRLTLWPFIIIKLPLCILTAGEIDVKFRERGWRAAKDPDQSRTQTAAAPYRWVTGAPHLVLFLIFRDSKDAKRERTTFQLLFEMWIYTGKLKVMFVDIKKKKFNNKNFHTKGVVCLFATFVVASHWIWALTEAPLSLINSFIYRMSN